jgi:hypothetical protein
VASMKPIDRCAEKRIDKCRSYAANFGAHRRVCSLQRGGILRHSRALSGRMRQIVRREAKFFVQFTAKIFESGSQFGFDSFARLRFLQPWKT